MSRGTSPSQFTAESDAPRCKRNLRKQTWQCESQTLTTTQGQPTLNKANYPVYKWQPFQSQTKIPQRQQIEQNWGAQCFHVQIKSRHALHNKKRNNFCSLQMTFDFPSCIFKLRWQDSTHSAMSGYPQEAATCSGVHPSLSAWFTLAPCSTRKDTISILPSMQAWSMLKWTKMNTSACTNGLEHQDQFLISYADTCASIPRRSSRLLVVLTVQATWRFNILLVQEATM